MLALLVCNLALLVILKVAQVWALNEHACAYDTVKGEIVRPVPPDAEMWRWDEKRRQIVPPDQDSRQLPAIPSDTVRGSVAPRSVIFAYRDLPLTMVVGFGLAERLDDFSFWNTLAAMLGALMFFAAFKNHPPKTEFESDIDYDRFTASCHSWSRLQFLLYLLIVFAFSTVYLIQVRRNHGDIHGTFFAETDITPVRLIQRVEGIANLLVMPAIYAYFFIAWNYLRTIYAHVAKFTGRSQSKTAVQTLINGCSVPTLLSLLAFVAINVQLVRIKPLAELPTVTPSLNLPEAMALFAIWYSPFLLLLIYAVAAKPAKLSFSFSLIGSQFVWLGVKYSEDGDGVDRSK